MLRTQPPKMKWAGNRKDFIMKLILILSILSVISCGEVQTAYDDNFKTKETEPKNDSDYDEVSITEGIVKGQVYYSLEQIRKGERPYDLYEFKIEIIGDRLVKKTWTDFSGNFKFYNIPPGEYILYATNKTVNATWVGDYTINIGSKKGLSVGIIRPRLITPTNTRENKFTNEIPKEDKNKNNNIKIIKTVAPSSFEIKKSKTELIRELNIKMNKEFVKKYGTTEENAIDKDEIDFESDNSSNDNSNSNNNSSSENDYETQS